LFEIFTFVSKESLVRKPKECISIFVDGIPNKPIGVD